MEEKIIETSEGVVPYLKLGRGSVALFLHGAIATPRAYLPFLKLLSEKFTVFAPTHPGHGTALPLPKDWELADFTRITKIFLKRLNIKPRIIVGHSFGGTISLMLGQYYPKSVLVSIGGPVFPVRITPVQYASFLKIETKNLLDRKPDLEKMKEVVPAAGTLVYTVVRHPEDPSWFLDNLININISHILSGLKNQIFLIWGEEDKIVPVTQTTEMIKLISNGSLKIYKNKGHIFVITEPELVYREITADLNRIKFDYN